MTSSTAGLNCGKAIVLGCMASMLVTAFGGENGPSTLQPVTPPATTPSPAPPQGPLFNSAQCAGAWGTGTVKSQWVYPNASGVLTYRPLNSNGDSIMDFSAAGYMGGGVALPKLKPTVTVVPVGNGADDTASIQQAIDAVSAMAANGSGSRGVVLLAAGNFFVSGMLTISTSGVVLRGSGSGTSGTVINYTNSMQNGTTSAVPSPGAATFELLYVNGNGSYTKDTTSSTAITNAYVPAGATTLNLSNSAPFQVGSLIVIERPVTSAWVTFMQMANLGVGKTWIKPGSNTSWQRIVTAIKGNQITLNVPLSDSLDATYINPPGGMVSLSKLNNPLQQVGIEHIRFVGIPRTPNTNNTMLNVNNIVDSWINDVVGKNFTSGVLIGHGASRITARAIALTHENNTPDVPCRGAKFADFSVGGSQILLDKSSSTGSAASFYYVTQSATGGPNVVLNFKGTPDAKCRNSSIQPHQRWATGLLVDGATLAPNVKDTGSIDFINRGGAGSGQGWSMGWGVVWNSVGAFNIQKPPGSMNWLIGNRGAVIAQPIEQLGLIDSPNVPVAPQSLYLAQMCQRLGPTALTNIGY